MIGSTDFNKTKRNLFDNLEPSKSQMKSGSNLFRLKSTEASSGILKPNDSFLKQPTEKKVSWGPTTTYSEQASLFKKDTGSATQPTQSNKPFTSQKSVTQQG